MISWICFEWETANLPAVEEPIAPLLIRVAEENEEQIVRKAILSAFILDSAWSDVTQALKKRLEASIELAFAASLPTCLVLIHGSRIIGASVLHPDLSAEIHLLTGPCILHEYRNRGLGTELLKASLAYLRDANIDIARGVTRKNSIAGRFVYTKFGSALKPCSINPLQLK